MSQNKFNEIHLFVDETGLLANIDAYNPKTRGKDLCLVGGVVFWGNTTNSTRAWRKFLKKPSQRITESTVGASYITTIARELKNWAPNIGRKKRVPRRPSRRVATRRLRRPFPGRFDSARKRPRRPLFFVERKRRGQPLSLYVAVSYRAGRFLGRNGATLDEGRENRRSHRQSSTRFTARRRSNSLDQSAFGSTCAPPLS